MVGGSQKLPEREQALGKRTRLPGELAKMPDGRDADFPLRRHEY
jgi:hypothetical protein